MTALAGNVRGVLGAILFFATAVFQVQATLPASVEFPFEFHDGFLWVDVSVAQSREPLHFLLDTGASVSVINLKTARHLKLCLAQPVAVQGVESTCRGYWPERLNAKVNQVPLQNNCLAVDLEQLGNACNCCVDGLIGLDFFRGKIVQIDFANHKIRLLKSSKEICGEISIPLKLRPCGMEIPVQVDNSKPRLVRLDTGCASPVQWVTTEIDPKKCSQRPAIALSRFKIEETKGNVRLGDAEFQSVPIGLHSKAIFMGESGIVGNGILSRFKTVTIDTVDGRLVLGEQIP